MAANHYSLPTIAKHLLVAAIAASPMPVVASAELTPDQQWICKADANNQWQCEGQSKVSHSTTLSLPNAKVVASQNSLDSTWDWVPKSQLADPSVCKTGCDGAYVAPLADWEDADKDPEGAPLRANADHSHMQGNSVALSGEVVLTQGNRSFKTDRALLDRDNNQLTFEGNVEIREPGLLIRADKANINTESNLGNFEQALFLQHNHGSKGNGFRGQAATIDRASQTTLDLEQGKITQCTPDDELWMIDANSIHLDSEEGWGSAKHAKVRIKDIPVFYTPYMTFPIDDRRKTGLLFPALGTGNKNGFEFSAPLYLNIAPDFDATIAPRFIEKRGTMYEAEVRQLSSFGTWVVSGAQLKDDQYQEVDDTDAPIEELLGRENDIPPRENRWVGRVTHSGKIGPIITQVDYNKVSDENFFSDLSPDSLELQRSDHLKQTASLGYRNNNWQAELIAEQFQTIDDLLSSQYQFMPRLTLERNSTGANFSPEWLFEAQYTDFKHDESIDDGGRFETGQRSFAEAGISYPMRWAPGFIIPTAKVRSVNYKLDAFKNDSDDTPSATVPLVTLDMGLVFERQARFGNSNYLQTLEPRLYYFYSDYEEQGSNPKFDTKALKFSYSQLFRDTRFTGHDRLDDANQASIGVTSRFINDTEGREVLSLSLGQIFYFKDRRVQLSTATPDEVVSHSEIAGEIQYQPTEKLRLTNTLLWDSRQDYLQEGGLGVHYQATSKSLYNLGYRFNREAASNLGFGKRDVSQADASVVLPIDDRWSTFARYRYDVEENRAIDDMFGLQYEDCCWMVRLLYQRSLKDEYVDNELTSNIAVERDYAFILEFELKGLGSLGNKARSLLEENILGYEDLD